MLVLVRLGAHWHLSFQRCPQAQHYVTFEVCSMEAEQAAGNPQSKGKDSIETRHGIVCTATRLCKEQMFAKHAVTNVDLSDS